MTKSRRTTDYKKNIGEVNLCSKYNAYRAKGLRANLSNEINEILANEATKNASVM